MAKQTINVGTTANDRTGDPLRIAFQKTNSNFTELYTVVENVEVPTNLSELNNDVGFVTANSIPSPTSTEYIELTQRYFLESPVTFAKVVGVDEEDEIDTGLVLARDPTSVPGNGGIYNSAAEEIWNALESPVGLLWNWDGWDNLDNVKLRQYTNFRQVLKNKIGENVIGAELVAHDTINDKYYTFQFTQWSQGAEHDGIFAYTRRLINVSSNIGIIFADGSNLVTAPLRFTRYPQTFIGDTSDFVFRELDAGHHIYVFGRDLTLPNDNELQVPIGTVFTIVTGEFSELYPTLTRIVPKAYVGQDSAVIFNKFFQEEDGEIILPELSICTLIKVAENSWQISSVPTDVSDLTDTQGLLVGGPVQPYMELTNVPFIIQPPVLGTPVTITVPNKGYDARLSIVIGEGPSVESVAITTPGYNYVVGQRYRVWWYDIGGVNEDSSIEFFVDNVGEDGELLAISNTEFFGVASNTPGTYSDLYIDYRPSVFDEIDFGLTLTRGGVNGIYNSELEQEYDDNNYLSPLGTEWNSDGWGNLLQLGLRNYTTWRSALNNQVGNNILNSELVMHDITNDTYYKFDFTQWNGSNGGYSYTRTEVTDPNYFKKPHNDEAFDIIVEDDPLGTGVIIGRTDSTGIYNLAQEEGFSNATSPLGTTWNADGWDDLSDLTTRTYTSFDTAANGYNNVLNKKFVMYVASVQKYYAIEFLEWATNGDNNFAYIRYEIDQTKLNEGVKFPDGTVLKSAAGLGRVKSTAPINRRIEEVTGFNQVSVTQVVTNDYTGVSSRTTSFNYEIFVERTVALDAILQPIQNGSVNAQIQISFDNVTFNPAFLATIRDDPAEYWFYYNNVPGYVPQTQGDPVYIRITSGGDPAVWWDKSELPGGSQYFRGAVIDYHAYTGESTIIGTIHVVDDAGENHISHQEVQSGSTDGENDDLWLVTQEGQIRYRRIDGESKTLKIHWTAKVFYGSETWD